MAGIVTKLTQLVGAGLYKLIAKGNGFSAVNTGTGGWYSIIREPWAGAWQANMTVDAPGDLLAFSGVYAPLTLIAQDISKLRIKLTQDTADGICVEVTELSPFLPVLRRPNHYQNRIKFLEQWIVSKLLYGNTYVLKERDARGVVVALYILDARRVTVLVADNGDVYYKLNADNLSGVFDKEITVPATEIIHDMMVSLWHPLCGISPITAAGMSATQGRKIQNNSSKFFDNMSRPSGALTAPGTISDVTAQRLKTEFEANFSGSNLGRLAVLGDGLKYEAMTIPAEQAQLIEQLEWTTKDIANVFHVPLYKVGGPVPANHTIEALNLQYYTDCLQSLIEQFELCMTEGLALPNKYGVELDISQLARMDTVSQIEMLSKAVGGSIMSPNEARQRMNLAPKPGGESPMIQQQNYSLAALAKRDAKEDPFAPAKAPAAPAVAAPAPAPAEDDEAQKAARTVRLIKRLKMKVKENGPVTVAI